MVPIRLQLKNFMSYGEGVPPLELAGIRLACFSGDNGNGKTALLDAMTWALFGETRASAEDDIIRLGATDVRVLFDFLVEGVKYRVHKGRGKRGGAIWELQIWQEDGTTRSLTGVNRNETKAKIQQLLRMDYRTFLATGYFAQGRADEFARASVSDRKKVLADILDLSRYERLEALAVEKRKEAESHETDADREINALDRELENEDRYFLALEDAQKRLGVAHDEAARLQTEYEALNDLIKNLDERENTAREYEGRISDIREEIAHNAQTLKAARARIASAEQIAARKNEINGAFAAHTSLLARIGPLEAQYGSVLVLQKESQSLEKTISAELQELDRKRYQVEHEAKSLAQETKELVRLDEETALLETHIAEYGDPDAKRREADAGRTETENRIAELREQHAGLKARHDALQKRLEALSESDSALCEYCGQSLPPARRQTARAETEAEIAQIGAEMRALAAEGKEAKRESDEWKRQSADADSHSRAVAGLEIRRAQAVQERTRLQERLATLPSVEARLAQFVERIARRDYAPDAQERLMKIAAHLEKSERVQQDLADARNEMKLYADAPRDVERLENAERTLAEEPPQAEQMEQLIAKREGQIVKGQVAIDKIRRDTIALPTFRRDQAVLAASVAEAKRADAQAQREIGQYEALLARCAAAKNDRVKRVEEKRAAARDKDVFKELIAAFGKKGVQALIIENALPEIQENANELLGRMTDGAMQVQLLTQREAKSKNTGAIETLDIIISDDMGTRPYEMFSGGEAFRINFALRVALSKMLARRAGAPLQTLIIDEGFGTQDPRGREAIIDALQTVSTEFALVLAITHIDELKEQFPTRIEVVKGATGSSFTIA